MRVRLAGALFSLFPGSLLGIVQAAASRMGFGRNLSFGPALLSAALIWLLGGSQWWQAYIRFGFWRIIFFRYDTGGTRSRPIAVFPY